MPKSKLDREALGKVASNFKALSEPTRLAILQELKAGPKTVNTLVEAVGLSQANISKQLRILHDAGFLCREQRGTRVTYAIGDPMVMQLCALVCDHLNRKAKAGIRNFSL